METLPLGMLGVQLRKHIDTAACQLSGIPALQLDDRELERAGEKAPVPRRLFLLSATGSCACIMHENWARDCSIKALDTGPRQISVTGLRTSLMVIGQEQGVARPTA